MSEAHCAEIAFHEDRVWFRNSQQPETVLTFELPVWATFVAAAKAGALEAPPTGQL
ncbi:DUF397 domain-containing protein [Phytohabitans rumicis]|uniref:DUF397 domain-containing protein n=1 Tax=Phytohabitans rumicis TaxID=1076125 RepID=UPI0015654453